MERPLHVVGHRSPDVDSIGTAIAYAELLNRTGDREAKAVRTGPIDAETAYVLDRFDVPAPELLRDAAGLDLVLVDHNEVAQAPPGVCDARVVEVWEHHRLGDLYVPEPIVFHIDPVGATATLVAEQYFQRGVTPSKQAAGLLLAAILSDTVVFRSPTTTDKDRQMAARLAPVAGEDPEALGAALLRAKTSAVAGKSPRELVRHDFKEFAVGGVRIGIAQVEVIACAPVREQRRDVLREMEARREALGLELFVFMLTDVTTGASDLWAVGPRRDMFERAFGPLEDGGTQCARCMSRKKQVLPRIEAAFRDARHDEARSEL